MNLGDDLFLCAICNRYPKFEFIIECDSQYSVAFNNLSNLMIVSDINDIKDTICLQIFLGGSLFMQPKNEKNIKSKYIDTIKKNTFNAPYIIIGANFGPYNNMQHLHLYQDWFQWANDICFRDLWSKNQFPSLNNIRWAPDIILGQHNLLCEKDFIATERAISLSLINNNGRIGLPCYSEKTYISSLSSAIQKYIEQDYRIKLLSFCPKQGDTIISQKIKDNLSSTYRYKTEIIEYNGDISRFIENGYNCEYIIGTRFHSVIIAWCLNIKVLPIIYNDKMRHVIEDYTFPYDYLDITQLKNATFESFDSNRSRQPWNCENLKCFSNEHFSYLDKFVRRIK